MRDEPVTPRSCRIGVLLVVVAFTLGGCLLNTATNVAKRFVASVKHLQWDKMETLVDWPASEHALGRPLQNNRREVLTDVAESISGYDISYYGEKRAKSNFLFFKVTRVEVLKKTKDLARLKITLKRTSEQSTTFDMTTRRSDRIWRVVLTPNLLEKRYISY